MRRSAFIGLGAAALGMAAHVAPVGTTRHVDAARQPTGTAPPPAPEEPAVSRPWQRASRRTRGHEDKAALDALVDAAQAKRDRKAAKLQRDAAKSRP